MFSIGKQKTLPLASLAMQVGGVEGQNDHDGAGDVGDGFGEDPVHFVGVCVFFLVRGGRGNQSFRWRRPVTVIVCGIGDTFPLLGFLAFEREWFHHS